MMLRDFSFATAKQKVLYFLCENMGKEFHDADIARNMYNVSRASVNNALRDLADLGIIRRKRLGNLFLNSVDAKNIFIQEYRKMMYITELFALIEEIRPWVSFMSIFGDYLTKPLESDMPIGDICIVTVKPERVYRMFKDHYYAKYFQVLLYTDEQFALFQKESPTIWKEVHEGLRLI